MVYTSDYFSELIFVQVCIAVGKYVVSNFLLLKLITYLTTTVHTKYGRHWCIFLMYSKPSDNVLKLKNIIQWRQ